MKKYLIYAFFLLVVLLAGWLGWRIWQAVAAGKDAKKKGEAPVPVTVAEAAKKSVPVEIRTFGAVEPMSAVAVRPQITGMLMTAHFREGQDVRKGDLLLAIDPRPFDAALKQAEAVLARDSAQLRNAEKEKARQEELFKKGVVAEDASDQARANAEALAATVRADEAAVTNARLQLAYCSIESPIDGRAGGLMVDPGNVVKLNDTVLLTINQIKPIRVTFAVPQQQLPRIADRMSKGEIEIEAVIPGGTGSSCKGKLTFIDNAVDTATGAILVKGTFSNDEGRLWPGQFVNVVVTLETQADALVIPSSAIQSGQKGEGVFVVKPDMTVESRFVTVDRAHGDEVVVSKGLDEGEQVVTDGQLQLRQGSTVLVKSLSGKKDLPRK